VGACLSLFQASLSGAISDSQISDRRLCAFQAQAPACTSEEMVRSLRVVVPVVALAALGPAHGFLPSSQGLCPACPAVVRSVSLQMSSSRGPSSDDNNRARKTLSGSGEPKSSSPKGLTKCLDVLGRSLAASATLLSICFSSPAPSEALDIGRFGRQGTVDSKTVVKQVSRGDRDSVCLIQAQMVAHVSADVDKVRHCAYWAHEGYLCFIWCTRTLDARACAQIGGQTQKR
jgi:hypothetical protein